MNRVDSARPVAAQTTEPFALVAVLIGVPLAYFLRFGYQFGHSDQDEFLPWLASRMDGVLLNDWFVASQLQGFNVRSGFVFLLEQPSRFMGIEGAVLALYALAGLGLVVGLYQLAVRLGASTMGAAVSPLLALVLIPRWTLGGNAATSSMLVPSMLAWSLGVWALVTLLGRRERLAGVLIGLGAWVQILVVAQLGAICLLALIWRDRKPSAALLHFSAPALALAVPVVLLLQGEGTGLPADSFDILARVRAPHHYLPDAFPARDYVQVGLLTLAGLLALRRTHLARPAARNRAVDGLLIGVGIAVAVGLVAWVFDLGMILSLQPFKATVLSGLIFSASLGAAIPPLTLPRSVWIGAVALAILGWGAVGQGVRVAEKPPKDRASAQVEEVADWAAHSTPPNSRFAVPPSLSGFRFSARRSIVVNFKAYPFTAEGAAEWMERIGAWSAGAVPARPSPDFRGGVPLLVDLDAAYERLDAPASLALLSHWEADYLLRRTPLAVADTLFELVHDGAVLVYTPTKR